MFCRMSSEAMFNCWICPETFTKTKDLKDHAIGKHSVCKMICPWCINEERTFARMSELTKHTKRKHQDLVLDLLEGEFFTEQNGFWLARRPSDYVKIIKPTDWTTTIAIRTRAALLGWVERLKKESTDYERYKKEWEDGWKKALGHSVTSQQAPRKRKYSPSRPSLDFPELVVARVELSTKGKSAYLRMEESATEVWFKVELVHWVMDDPKAKENLLRRMSGITGDKEPPEKFVTELKLGESQFTLKTIVRVLGINERHVRRIYRGKVSFEKTRKMHLQDKDEDYGEEPEYEIMDEIEDAQDCEDEEEAVSRRIVIVEDKELGKTKHQEEEAEERQEQEVKEQREKEAKEREQEAKEQREKVAKEQREREAGEQEQMKKREQEEKEQEQEAKEQLEQEAKVREIKEQQDTDVCRAEKLLKRGGMPLFPPGRRQWRERQVLISSTPTKMYWPPRNWQEYTPTEKLTSWRFVAMALVREEGMSECRSERDILDEYAMLALPGTPVEKSTERSWITTTRTANYNILREICLGRLSGEEAKGWLAMFEAAGSEIPGGKLYKQLELIPLRLDTEKDEKD